MLDKDWACVGMGFGLYFLSRKGKICFIYKLGLQITTGADCFRIA